MYIGQRVTINSSTDSMYSGQKGTITGFNNRVFNVDVQLDNGQRPFGGKLPFHEDELTAEPTNDLPARFQSKKDALLGEVHEFADSAAQGTLGDYSELGFLASLLQILMED